MASPGPKPEISVEKVAKLAYLQLSQAEAQSFQSQFDAILGYVGKLNEVSMSEAEAKAMGAFHITSAFYDLLKLDPSTSLRNENDSKSVSTLNLTNDEALKNSPKSGGIPGELLFEVPSIIER